MTPESLEQLLKNEIPISEEMGISTLQWTADGLRLKLPLHPNRNHKGTLFGGSLYSACALACYGLFLKGLREAQIQTNNIVISEGGMKYLKPVDQDAWVGAEWVSSEERSRFFESLAAKGKARVTMKARVVIADSVCAEFSGRFVALV